ncbi:hypothetical protein [Nocardia amamiensis]|uniref:hypothetical protein n=1 Tax=Nocardia TaxID=1817 RepID=UPI0033DAC192
MSEEDRKTLSDLKQLAEEGENPYYEDYDVLESRSRGYIEGEMIPGNSLHLERILAKIAKDKGHPSSS